MQEITGVTISVFSRPFGRPPIGPLSPSVEPNHPTIAAAFFNIQNRFSWAKEMLMQRADGKLPNLAPPNVSYQARRIKSTQPQVQGGYPVALQTPNSGFKWLGTEGPA